MYAGSFFSFRVLNIYITLIIIMLTEIPISYYFELYLYVLTTEEGIVGKQRRLKQQPMSRPG